MRITVREQGGERSIEAEPESTVLEALQRAGIVVDAPCGGAGTCGKCRMLIRDGAGLSWRLACQTPAADGMETVVERSGSMAVSVAGAGCTQGAAAAGTDRAAAPGSAGYGIAVDVGTTTVVCRLHDLATGRILGARGISNPQIMYGADVISRISAASEGNLEALRELIGETVCTLAGELAHEAGISPRDVRGAVLAGNTVMEHLAAGIDPSPIGVAPFEPPTLFGSAVDLGDGAGAAKGAEPGDRREDAGTAKRRGTAGSTRGARAELPACRATWFAPCVAGYVGGDIICGILACGMEQEQAPALFLDLGTNGEMALGDASGITTCATAAGPVFEGANIAFGMPAYPGAIAHVSRAGDELRLETIGGGEPVGLCGTGLIDAIALLLDAGIVDETGYLLDEDEAAEIAGADGADATARVLAPLVGAFEGAAAVWLTPHVAITQRDVRNYQLAKAAIAAGIETLLAARGIGVGDVGRLVIAGGFGAALDPARAARTGLFPAELVDRAEAAGNTSIEGASAALVSREARVELKRIAAACDYVELSTTPAFNAAYVGAMEFPE